MAKKYLAYCRVSTKAQADRDNSLPTQKRIIEEYALKKEYEIVEWYSEAKSGFKGNRQEFKKMLEHLKNPEVEGVIFHKLDRSARNVADFALLDQMVTINKKKMVIIEGEFDTGRAAGRLAFRNFCNMAVWYSENLSEEVSTKMEEVLMKGYFPAPAPIGYRIGIKGVDEDHKMKYQDPKVAPFVKEAFELFSTGNYSIISLCDYMRKKGMTNTAGNRIRNSSFHKMLRNPFYHGLVTWKKKGQKNPSIYEGSHKPIISKKLFDKVQDILDGRSQQNKTKHDYAYSKMIKCECGWYLVSGTHKGKVYLECHNRDCKFSSIREDRLEDQIIAHLSQCELADEFIEYSKEAIHRLSSKIRDDNADKRKGLNMKLGKLDQELEKLNKAVLDGFFTTEEGLERKNNIVEARHALRMEIAKSEDGKEDALWNLTAEVIKIFNFLPYRYRELNPITKRKLLNILFLNRELQGQKLLIQAVPVFEKLQSANYLIRGQKLLLNRVQQAKKPLKLALPKAGVELDTASVQNGGHGWI